MRKRRPRHSAWEALQSLVEAEERRWIAAPSRWLDGRSPQEAVADPQALYDVYDLLEWLALSSERTDGYLSWFNIDRVRRSLGLGRRW